MRRPRVLWAGIIGDTSALAALQTSVTAATETFGEPPEDRPFKAHLTLARVPHSERCDSLEKIIARPFSIPAAWNVAELIFMQSRLSPHGASYEAIASWRLG
jgi:RNA 2',3'-cyclic 3'-phosphodiesterase